MARCQLHNNHAAAVLRLIPLLTRPSVLSLCPRTPLQRQRRINHRECDRPLRVQQGLRNTQTEVQRVLQQLVIPRAPQQQLVPQTHCYPLMSTRNMRITVSARVSSSTHSTSCAASLRPPTMLISLACGVSVSARSRAICMSHDTPRERGEGGGTPQRRQRRNRAPHPTPACPTARSPSYRLQVCLVVPRQMQTTALPIGRTRMIPTCRDPRSNGSRRGGEARAVIDRASREDANGRANCRATPWSAARIVAAHASPSGRSSSSSQHSCLYTISQR